MASVPRHFAVPRVPWRPVWSRPAALRAVRAAVVMPICSRWPSRASTTCRWRCSLRSAPSPRSCWPASPAPGGTSCVAHLGLAAGRAACCSIIGTAVTLLARSRRSSPCRSTFAVFFAGVLGPNAATGVTGALLAYVLPAASPGTMSMVPDRLAGWWLASVVGTAAVLAPSPPPPTGTRLRAAAADAGARAGRRARRGARRARPTEAPLRRCLEAKHGLLGTVQRHAVSPHRPGRCATRRWPSAVELLEWCTALVADAVRERGDLCDASPRTASCSRPPPACCAPSAALFAGRRASRPTSTASRPAPSRASSALTQRCARARPSFADQAAGRLSRPRDRDGRAGDRRRGAAVAELVDPEWIEARASAGSTACRPAHGPPRLVRARTPGTAARHASVRSVWFINSLRGALALGGGGGGGRPAPASSMGSGSCSARCRCCAPTPPPPARPRCARWPARSSASSSAARCWWRSARSRRRCGWSLPIAVLVAAYAPGTAPFAVGQAAFTVTVAVLFNLLVPVGWKVGELRVEDVAIGCAVSLAGRHAVLAARRGRRWSATTSPTPTAPAPPI